LAGAQVNDRWEICVSVSDGQFQQASGGCKRRLCLQVSFLLTALPAAPAGELREQHQHHQGRHARQLHRRRRGRVRLARLRRLSSCAAAESTPRCACSKLLERILKKNKSAGVKPFQVKSHLWVFVNALVENPAFDSQARPTRAQPRSHHPH
jgi:hypothetical protein